MIVAVIGC